MTCRDVIEFLCDYINGELPADDRKLFDDHLAICPACVAYLNTYRETIHMEKEAFEESDSKIDEPLPEPLVRAILAAWKNSPRK